MKEYLKMYVFWQIVGLIMVAIVCALCTYLGYEPEYVPFAVIWSGIFAGSMTYVEYSESKHDKG